MEFSVFKIDNYIEEVEKFTNFYKRKLEDEKREVENSKREISRLSNSFFAKDIDSNRKFIEPMKISLSNRSLFDTIFKEDTQNGFLLGDNHEEKRRRLAAERRAEYNSFLERKKRETKLKQRVNEGMSNTVIPRSILESVDYETVLAKRKEEELKFRQLNYAEPSICDDVKNHQKSGSSERSHSSEHYTNHARYKRNPDANHGEKNHVNHQGDLNSITSRNISNRPLSSEERHSHRTGGGGEPVKDFLGNLITARGFRDTAPILQLPSYNLDLGANKKSSYREELAKQIEEKKRLAALEKQKAQELEDRVAQRIEEQRRQMQLEYEKELKERDKIKLERQEERIKQFEEFQRKEAERKQKLKENKIVESKPPVRENVDESLTESRSSSPPVPSVRSKVIFEKAVSPVLSTAKILKEVPVKPENIFSSLAEIRKKIMQDQQYLKGIKGSYEVTDRRTVHDDDDDEDNTVGGIVEQLKNLKT